MNTIFLIVRIVGIVMVAVAAVQLGRLQEKISRLSAAADEILKRRRAYVKHGYEMGAAMFAALLGFEYIVYQTVGDIPMGATHLVPVGGFSLAFALMFWCFFHERTLLLAIKEFPKDEQLTPSLSCLQFWARALGSGAFLLLIGALMKMWG